MPNLLQQGAEMLQTIRAAHASETITYVRGEDSVELVAGVGEPPSAVMDSDGVITEYVPRDYMVAAADLVLSEVAVTPQSGDVIQQTIGGVVKEFQVMASGSDKPWRWSDPGETVMRIHTKQVA